ncbi:MAG: TonB-dependent receptor [Thiobacillus sp.]
MLRPTLLVAALAVAFPAFADADLDALRAEIKQMKTDYEARIQSLETRLKTAEQTSAEKPAADTTAIASKSTSASAFNPEISLILQGRYAHQRDLPERRISGFLPNGQAGGTTRGFSADESELVISANIDPNFRGYFNAVLNDGEIGVEEAWFQTLSLGRGFTVKGGRLRSGLGYQNEQHPHAWDFATQNLMYEALFGEAYAQDGLQLRWLAPTDLFTELGAEVGRGANFPGTDRNKNGMGSYTLFGHVGGDIGDSHSWRGGLAYLSTRATARSGVVTDFAEVPVNTSFTGESKTWVADFVWKWAPQGNASVNNFKFATELFRRNESGDLLCDDLDATNPSSCSGGISDAYRTAQYGGYAQGVYQFMPRWRAGYRYDWLNPGSRDFGANDANLPRPVYNPVRHSLMLDYSPSEFTRFRVQYSKDQAMPGQDENQWFVQYIYSLGAHGAHAF